MLPRLSRSANHSRLWLGVAAGVALSGLGGPRARRGAVRGVTALALASATVNTLGKWSVGRDRPLLEHVPAIRRLKHQPTSTSFPSGHAASAVAFTTGMALESPGWGVALAPVAAAVAFSRVYTGVHYPSDVLAGAALGAGAALTVRALLAPDSQPPQAIEQVPAPALPDGRGLAVVVNRASGTASFAQEVRRLLPEAELTFWDPAEGPPDTLLEKAAQRAAELGGALGVLGGDGSVSAAAPVALRYGIPLAVLPGGTYNHLALDLGIGRPGEAARAVTAGEAIAVDLARFTPAPGSGPDGSGHFVNTFSLGSYPELVSIRRRWAGRIGPWAAGVLAAVQVLREARPVEATFNGKRRAVWLLFAGNCAYHHLSSTAARRPNLSDGLLDIHVVRGGRWARTRLLLAALTGGLHSSPVHGTARMRRLLISDIAAGTLCAYDGETAEAPRDLLLDKEAQPLTVYRPLPPWMRL